LDYERQDDSGGSGTFPTSPSRSVAEIPLFPLDLVLFPNMMFQLHIFEERYKEMINRCVRESLPFGIVLATGMNNITGSVETSPVGCTARISRVERLPDGCMNIEIIGEERFHILDTHEQQSYRTGLTERYDDSPNATEAQIQPLCEEVMELLRDFLVRSLAMMGKRIEKFELPYHPQQISFTPACLLPLTNEEKQKILADREVLSRLALSREMLQREIERLRRAAESVKVTWKKVELSHFDEYRCEN
jgi:Lon protease-like protein